MNREPYYEYLLVMPSGDCKGFNDLNEAKAFINFYYERKIDEDIEEHEYNDQTDIGGRASRENICTQLGVEEGRCEVYSTEELIKLIDKELVFDNEKEEIIEKLSDADLDINLYDYNLDVIISNIDVIDMMEPYGEKN